MNKRIEELSKLRAYTEDIDKDLTMILQSLQWDRKHILEHSTMISCKYDSNHRVLPSKVEEHEQECLLRHNGYTREDNLLPDPLDPAACTLIKLTKEDIMNTIDNAAKSDPMFRRVCIDTLNGSKRVSPLYIGSGEVEPLSLGRLQYAYSADERRVIHDAVVSAAPACHDLTDLALPSDGADEQAPKAKSRTEILAELRNMRRRRTKYRVATKSRNYSDVLRDVIKSQMELYNGAIGEVETKPDITELDAIINEQTHSERNDDIHGRAGDRDRRDKRETDRDGEPNRRQRSDRDYRSKSRRHDGSQSGDRDRNRDDSGERRHDRRRYSDHRSRELPKEIKRELGNDDNDYRHRSGEMGYRNKSKERKYDDRRDRDRKRKERSVERRSRDQKHRDRGKERDRSRDKYDPDTKRARALIKEIKREIESVERSEGDGVDKDVSAYNKSIEVDHYRDYTSREGRDSHNRDDNNSHRHTNVDQSHTGRSTERRKHSDGRENEDKYKESEADRRKGSYRDRNVEDKMRSSRAEDKHRRYYEIYSELDKRRNRKSIDE